MNVNSFRGLPPDSPEVMPFYSSPDVPLEPEDRERLARTAEFFELAEDYAKKGLAYVFARSGSMWLLQQRLAASDGADGDQFGNAVALSSDGNTAGPTADR